MNTRSLLPLSFLSLVACSSAADGGPGSGAKIEIASSVAGAVSVKLLADGPLTVGRTDLYFAIATADGAAVLDATLEVLPAMTMASGMKHGCPVLAPAALASDDLYHTALVFQMASTATDTWSLTVRIHRTSGVVDVVLPALVVAASGRAKTFTTTDAGGATLAYVASMNLVGPAQVGLNDVLVTLHAKADMWTFPPVDDAVLALDPQMPSMGHGSPGSVDPTWIAPGLYQGRLSLSMPGDWETTLTIARAGSVLAAPVFATRF